MGETRFSSGRQKRLERHGFDPFGERVAAAMRAWAN